MTVGKPEVVTRMIDGKLHEPTERLVVDVPEEHMGAVTRLLAPRRGRLLGTGNHGGGRVRMVVNELRGEKIDIVDFDQDPAKFVAHALAPAKVSSVEIVDEDARSAKVIVPDYQLSLAIGKDGQNARLAARLTGAKIDIHPDNPVERIIKPSKIVEMEAKAKAAAQAEEEARLAAEEASKIEAANPEITQEPDSHLGEGAKDE